MMIEGPVSLSAGVSKTDWSWAPLIADFDNDGFQDLYIGNIGGNRLLRNNGDGKWTDVNLSYDHLKQREQNAKNHLEIALKPYTDNYLVDLYLTYLKQPPHLRKK